MNLVRWPGKPTSGRFVYRGRSSGRWFWQCDLHDEEDPPPDQYGEALTMPEAFAAAMVHALVCPYSNERGPRYHPEPTS